MSEYISYKKLIDINSGKVVAVSESSLLRYVKLNTNNIPIKCDIDDPKCFGINFFGKIYNLQDKEEYHVEKYSVVRTEDISGKEYNQLYNVLFSYNPQVEEQVTIIDTSTLDTVRDGVIENIRSICNQQIVSGIEVTFEDHTEHFDLTIEDQLNIQQIQLRLMSGENSVMYHCKSGPLRVYEKEELLVIIKEMQEHIYKHNAYFNLLKEYINNLTTIDELLSVEYGMEIPQ